jgi:hypothetical protein
MGLIGMIFQVVLTWYLTIEIRDLKRELLDYKQEAREKNWKNG